MADEKISLEDDEMQELAQLVAEALARGDSRESVIADLSKNGMSEGDAEEFVSLIEYQLYQIDTCLLYTSPSPRDATLSRMPSSA